MEFTMNSGVVNPVITLELAPDRERRQYRADTGAGAATAVPDFYGELGPARLISPLRLRGMSAMPTRIKRRLRGQLRRGLPNRQRRSRHREASRRLRR